MSDEIKIDVSAKNGSSSWIKQRVSALALIFLVIWLILSIFELVKDPIRIPIFFAYPLNCFMGILFIIFSLYHGSLGLKEVIEDYISGKFKKCFYIILIYFVSIVTAVASVVAILRLHLIG